MTTQQEADINELVRFIIEMEVFCTCPKVEQRCVEDNSHLVFIATGARIKIPKALFPSISPKHWQAANDTEKKLELGKLAEALNELKTRLTALAKERLTELVKL